MSVRHLLPFLLTVIVAGGLAAAGLGAGPGPSIINLPAGWQPEGIHVSGNGTFYVGSLTTGAVYRGSVKTGAGVTLVQPRTGRVAVGLEVDEKGRVFVAGGPTGQGYVYDRNGGELQTYAFATGSTFVNDVVVTKGAAWFTDSQRPFLYRIDLGKRGEPRGMRAIPLTGDLVYTAGFNVNGIEAARGGKVLILVQSNTGKLFRVDARTGATKEIRLGGDNVANGDGLLRHGETLYVVQNQLNRIAVIDLDSKLASGRVERLITNPAFDIPTTVGRFGNTLYAVNARFSTPATPTTPYQVVATPLKR
ncbi:MAG: SMP-30/gluconolactonase/LRE family protein [Gaiella sp.]